MKFVERQKRIIKVNIISIVVTAFLSLFKFIVGTLTNSIAIILDAVNNLSDALSSIISIVGTYLAGKAPDKKHPFGYGRIEYLSAMVIAGVILYAGITSLIESIKTIIHPKDVMYSKISIIILLVAIIIKIVLGIYVRNRGKKYNSLSLTNSGTDALFDSIISFSTLIAAIIYLVFEIKIEAYLGVIISFMIINSGIGMLRETISQILGERIDLDLSKNVKKVISSFKEVHGVYDLILNNYGPDNYLGSVHIEIDDSLNAIDIDHLTRKINTKVFDETGVILTAVGIYSINTNDEESMEIKNKILEVVERYKVVIQMHGFYFNKKNKDINFDIVVSFDCNNKKEVYNNILEEVEKMYPEYKIYISLDADISD
jgi:cation diffusion facilitator family transporter